MKKTPLRVILEERGIKQEWLAKKTNIHSTTLSKIVLGKSLPNLRNAQKIALALNTTVDKLWPYVPGEDE